MPGASLMMRFFGSPPRESRSASGPGTEADYNKAAEKDPGALRAAGEGAREAEQRPQCSAQDGVVFLGSVWMTTQAPVLVFGPGGARRKAPFSFTGGGAFSARSLEPIRRQLGVTPSKK